MAMDWLNMNILKQKHDELLANREEKRLRKQNNCKHPARKIFKLNDSAYYCRKCYFMCYNTGLDLELIRVLIRLDIQ